LDNHLVLVVDDEPAVTRMLTLALEMAGFRVHAVMDGVKALEFFRAHPGEVAVIITDVVMPKMNGIIMAERVLELDPAVHIIFISGYSDEALEVKARKSFPFFRKPFLPSDLIALIRELLGGAPSRPRCG